MSLAVALVLLRLRLWYGGHAVLTRTVVARQFLEVRGVISGRPGPVAMAVVGGGQFSRDTGTRADTGL